METLKEYLEGWDKPLNESFLSKIFNKKNNFKFKPESDGNLYCSNKKLTTLEGAPKKVNGDFDCTYNKLTSLKGAPKEVNGCFDCSNNDLVSLEGGPEKVEAEFTCFDNPRLSKKEIIKYSKKHPKLEIDSDFGFCVGGKFQKTPEPDFSDNEEIMKWKKEVGID